MRGGTVAEALRGIDTEKAISNMTNTDTIFFWMFFMMFMAENSSEKTLELYINYERLLVYPPVSLNKDI